MSVKIAIDGPSVSGKSSAAKRIASELGYLYLDSGALYRAATLAKLRGQLDFATDVREGLDSLDIRLEPAEKGCRVLLKGEDVSREIRSQEVTTNILPVSGNEGVRGWVNEKLRKIAGETNVVMDGRDIGTIVLPDADCKFFLTAGVEARARRRLADLQARGESENLSVLERQIAERDEGDRKRSNAPLRQADDAIFVDNSEMTFEETVLLFLEKIRERIKS